MTPPLIRGLGPTLIPRPQRMYLRFAEPIETTKPPRTGRDTWVETVKKRTQNSLEQAIADLLHLRRDDPYRELNPWKWRHALQPT